MSTGTIVLIIAVALVAVMAVRRRIQRKGLAEYTPAALDERMASAPPPLLLDVRTAAERQSGHIKGSTHIPVQELGSRMHELEKHRGREIICYCRSGNRSAAAAIVLRRQGFTVAHLAGGMAEWNFAHRAHTR
jgi:rhodanese-related sulfurtransferase